MARHLRLTGASMIAALALTACATSVTGRATRAPDQPPPGAPAAVHATISAHDLLLQDRDSTPLGPVTATGVGDSYFTTARPPECLAALLFKGSPLLPPGSSAHAESAYRVGGPALYAESVDVYENAQKTRAVVSKGFAALAQCHGEAVGVAPLGEFRSMRLSFFGTTDDGVLVWTVSRPDWTCDYGLAVAAQVALLMSACDTKPGFPMAEWASKRRAQIDRRTV
jgi:hypothetical protein